jgi:hypothetical protein
LPVFNRCVVFSTTSTSYHGHPTPLACPPGRTRKSLATYYYTNGRPAEEARPGHSTLFQQRLGQNGDGAANRLRRMAKRVARALLPPIVLDTYHSVQMRLARRRSGHRRAPSST